MSNVVKSKLDDNIHAVLPHSYMVYFTSFLVGLFLHFLFPLRVSSHPFLSYLGFIILLFAPFLILWAQTTSRTLNKNQITKDSFCRGPYCYTRMPTHLGLFLLMVGFGFLVNSFFILCFAFISFFINKFIFIAKEETLLLRKYGVAYLDYKKSVRF